MKHHSPTLSSQSRGRDTNSLPGQPLLIPLLLVKGLGHNHPHSCEQDTLRLTEDGAPDSDSLNGSSGRGLGSAVGLARTPSLCPTLVGQI